MALLLWRLSAPILVAHMRWEVKARRFLESTASGLQTLQLLLSQHELCRQDRGMWQTQAKVAMPELWE